MQVENSMPWHAGKTACTNTYRCGVCAAGQASSLPGSRRISASRALHVRAHTMACCMHIAHDMSNAAHMLSMHHGICVGGLGPAFQRTPESAVLWNAGLRAPTHARMHVNECMHIVVHAIHATRAHGMRARKWHVQPARTCSCEQRVHRHVRQRRNALTRALSETNGTCEKTRCHACACHMCLTGLAKP